MMFIITITVATVLFTLTTLWRWKKLGVKVAFRPFHPKNVY